MEIDVSVVVPCYNAEATIERALRSVLDQVDSPRELILVDDESTDGTYECLCRFRDANDSISIKVFKLEKNRGPSYSRNFGWEQANGKYVAFLDSDDVWHKYKLKLQYAVMEQDHELVITGHDFSNADEISSNYPESISVNEVTRHKLLITNQFKTASTLMVRNTCTSRFPDDKKYSEDYWFVLAVVLSGARAVYIDHVLGYRFKYAFGDTGLSSSLLRMEINELDNFVEMRQMKLISFPELVFAVFYSGLKFVRRALIVTIRNIKSDPAK